MHKITRYFSIRDKDGNEIDYFYTLEEAQEYCFYHKDNKHLTIVEVTK